ncbi:HD domain-containing protein [Patescibacteria group bacterium]
MLSRDEALDLLKKHIKTENTVKHMLALEAIMKALAKKLEPDKEKEWAMAGILHDLDYETVDQKTYEGHGLKTIEILKNEKVDLPESVIRAILAHNADILGDEYMPKNKIEWAMLIADSLTGLIVATALVRPDKKLASVKVKSIKKKFKQPSFAAGTRREQIAMCEEKLGIPMDEFFNLSLKAMQEISSELGL